MRRFLAGLIAAMALAVGDPAQAAITFERFIEDDGFKILLLKGEFEADETVDRLEDEVSDFGPDAIMFDSPGGIISTALEYGRKIRDLEMDTLQVRAHLCVSACAFAFAGGVNRSAEAGSIGVHQSWFPEDVSASDAVAGIQEITADVMGYLTEMDVDVRLLQLSMSTASGDMRFLTVQEMVDLGMVTTEVAAAEEAESEAYDGEVDAREDRLPRRRKMKPAG
ncbi:MAG: hypothetical protein NWR47_06070 [Aestuariivirgaceae bacterium]|nr:hypothetical protein [Aestuariivirgaceae bacterium]